MPGKVWFILEEVAAVVSLILVTKWTTVVPLMRDHKESPQKMVSQKGFALFGG